MTAPKPRATIHLLVVLESELPGEEPVELRVEARGVDFFRAEDLTGLDPWEVLGDLAGTSRLSNKFLRSVHALGFSAARRIAPTLTGDSFDRFLDRAIEVSIVSGDEEEGDAPVPDARPTVAVPGSA